ncbi:hypothetical protein CDAR_490062 [Caerostris darwini]|uniref:Uncharacterized protein n=1 Tax=Caerostris darwini TaxID=1538125 RepID=A0AAV4TP51_9ARAC|nr:hypothetical protein CDAR_490062 [Caerostris darwini]
MKFKYLGMKSEGSGSSTMIPTQKLLVIFGVIFCAGVTLLMVILYYPAPPIEKEFEDFENIPDLQYTVSIAEDWDFTNSEHFEENKIRFEAVARALEELGSAFLALLAVGCIAVGLTCLVCACCIFK